MSITHNNLNNYKHLLSYSDNEVFSDDNCKYLLSSMITSEVSTINLSPHTRQQKRTPTQLQNLHCIYQIPQRVRKKKHYSTENLRITLKSIQPGLLLQSKITDLLTYCLPLWKMNAYHFADILLRFFLHNTVKCSCSAIKTQKQLLTLICDMKYKDFHLINRLKTIHCDPL